MKGESLVYIVCASTVITCVCVILENISKVFIMGVYKNTKIPQNVLENLLVQMDIPGMLQCTPLQVIVYLVNP